VDHLELRIALPDWVVEFLAGRPLVLPAMEDRMRLVVDLARQNIRRQTGGPFGAAVFDEAGGLVAAGVNLVVSGHCSILHAEIVAVALAQKRLGRYDLGDQGRRQYELVTATEPCAMCFGAIPWSGVSRVVCGARDEDARGIGFDEGPKLPDWAGALASRGVRVTRDVLRAEAVAVLEEYARGGGHIY
jgi:tRNA(Arg) A34 adenosine deaminase TadA